MNRFLGFFVSLIASLGVVSAPAQAAGLPLVVSAAVNYTNGTLTITGQNFGSSPSVTLDSMTFPTLSVASSQIVANFPAGSPPSSFTPGTYFLTMQFPRQLPAIFTVDIGANGPQGPAGVQGSVGPQGAIGATGPAGPTGPAGTNGAMGPPGVPGQPGTNGTNGAQGLQGLQGAQGPPGATGINGTNGTGVPGCTAPNVFLVISSGALVCQPRFMANGDGTLTDNQTGLMWELATGTVGGTPNLNDDKDVNALYSPSPTNVEFSSSLGAGFLNFLNTDQSSSGGSTCFANHCDWRIPNVVELQTILQRTLIGGSNLIPGSGSPICLNSPCIDPAFGPTQPGAYWVNTLAADNNLNEWQVDFSNGSVYLKDRHTEAYARAVRGGR
jgi:Protein of unknown function (DUF1566)/Collagen triple helix repeat (20 copies)/IPT/TIG domain